jgi:integrase
MTTVKLKHVNCFLDRYGKPRCYFRQRGESWPLPMPEGGPEFMQAYNECLTRTVSPVAVERARKRPETQATPATVLHVKETLGWLITKYLGSHVYQSKALGTQRQYRDALELLRTGYGAALLKDITPNRVIKLRDKIAETRAPSTADRAVTMISMLWDYAVNDARLEMPPHPAQRIRKMQQRQSHKPWPPEVIDKFLATARPSLYVAVMLMHDTAQREGDILALKWTQFFPKEKTRDGTLMPCIKLTQAKTGRTLVIPVEGELLKLLMTMPRVHDNILTSERGKPFASTASLSRAITDHLHAIGHGEYVPHGLRHTALTEAAESGATTAELQALGGHRSKQTLELYTARANQPGLALSLIAKRRKTRGAA